MAISAPATVLPGNVYAENLVVGGSVSFPTGSINPEALSTSDQASPLSVTQQHAMRYAQEVGPVAATYRQVIGRARSTGTVVRVYAGCVTPAVGDSEVEIDVLKNGVSIMTAVVTINSSTVAFESKTGLVTTSSFSAGDIFEANFVASMNTGTLPEGCWLEVWTNEIAIV